MNGTLLLLLAAAAQVVLDPKTGALRTPTPEEAKALALPAPAAKPVVVTLPDGSRLIRLNGHHLSYAVARRKADGGVAVECGPSPRPSPTPEPHR